jgi:cyanophycinase
VIPRAIGLAFLLLLPLLLVGQPAVSGPLAAQEIGPANGSLVVVGGAMRDTTIVRRFLDLAGGAHRPIVVIPTAGGGEDYDDYWPGIRQFQRLGATNITVLHTNDRAEADSEEFTRPIREAAGVWFSGGRQWRLADSYLDTRTHEELWNLLERGGVIGGSSAGASIQGSYLVRGDSETNTVMMGDHEVGLGFLKGVGIDQHLLMRNRQFDMLEVIEAHPELLGIGIDENTAIVVSGDSFEVLGQGYVAIYDHGAMLDSGGRFYFLAPGDRFDMVTRTAARPQTRPQPLDRVEKRSWSQNSKDDGGDS